MSGKLFDGLKVIDCGSYIAAPAATMILGDLGADVIKIEPVGAGDPYSTVYLQSAQPRSEIDYGALLDNRGKRGIAIDLASDGGREIIHRLASQADVFVTNYPLPTRAKLGIDYETLAAINDRLIYGSFTAYGEAGEQANNPGFDTTAYWSRSGMMDQIRESADSEPVRSVPGMGDHPSAMSLYAGIVTALYQRERTGKGTLVRSSLLANGLWANGFLGTAALNGATFVPRPPREQSINALSSHYQCADGAWLVLAMLNEDRAWPHLVAGLEKPELAEDPRFVTRTERIKHARELFTILDEKFRQHDRGHWMRVRREQGVVFEVVATPDDVRTDAQAEANGFVVEYPALPGVRSMATPFFVGGAETVEPVPPPAVGEHTDDVLREIGYDDAELARLREAGAFG